MSKVTSKLQVTIPKSIADRYGIKPGTEVEWEAAGAVIRVVPPGQARTSRVLDTETRLRLWDEMMKRQDRRDRGGRAKHAKPPKTRGWARDDLYTRGRSR